MDTQALWLTLRLALTTTALLLVIALPLARWIVAGTGAVRALTQAVVALPLVLPPTVLGFYLLVALWMLLTGRSGRTAADRATTPLTSRDAARRPICYPAFLEGFVVALPGGGGQGATRTVWRAHHEPPAPQWSLSCLLRHQQDCDTGESAGSVR